MKTKELNLTHSDFLALMCIVRNRCEVEIFEAKLKLQDKRIRIAAEKGFKSTDYLSEVIGDFLWLRDTQEEPFMSVCALAKVSSEVLLNSYHYHIGDDEDANLNITAIIRHIEIFYMYPFKGTVEMENAPDFVKNVFEAVIERFDSDDLLLAGDHLDLDCFLGCFDIACQDYAKLKTNGAVKEQDFRQLVTDQKILS